MTKRSARKLPQWLLVIGGILVILTFVALTAEINVYGVVCWVHHFDPTPNAAWMRMNEDRPQQIRVDENTPVYVWQVDASNAICCFVTKDFILAERMYTKGGGFYATGWGSGLEYGKEPEPPTDPEEYAAVRLIRSNGLYGDEIRYTLVRVTDDLPRDRLVLTFPANDAEYGILIP